MATQHKLASDCWVVSANPTYDTIDLIKLKQHKKHGVAEEVGKEDEKTRRYIMIDDFDPSSSTLRLLVSDALKNWKIEGLLKLLEEDDVLVKTAAARELQLRGGKLVFEKIKVYSGSKLPQLREISAFILGQLEIPLLPYKNDSLPILLHLALDINADVRCAAAAFGHLFYEKMPKEVENILMNLCLDENKDVRACAAYSLGNSSGNQEIQNLLKEMVSQDYVGSYAELGLEMLIDKTRKTDTDSE